jgi:hypothetical protein
MRKIRKGAEHTAHGWNVRMLEGLKSKKHNNLKLT